MLDRPARPANVWGHDKRSTRFRHLLDTSMSGASGGGGGSASGGSRDISFLYDSTMRQQGLPPLSPGDAIDSHLLIASASSVDQPAVDSDRFTTRMLGEHPVPLPGLQPSGRAEAAQLLRSIDEMLAKAGVEDTSLEDAAPTDVHALLELVRKEQNIYDTCFAEIIRQVR